MIDVVCVEMLKTFQKQLNIIKLRALKSVDKPGFPMLVSCVKLIWEKAEKFSTVPSTGLSTGFQQPF